METIVNQRWRKTRNTVQGRVVETVGKVLATDWWTRTPEEEIE